MSQQRPDPFAEVTLADLRTRTSQKWRAHPEDVLPLWVAEMDVMLAEPVVVALQQAIARGDTGYACGTGYAESLRDFAAERWGWDALEVANTAIVADVMTGIVEVLRLLTAAGDAVVINCPVYPPFFSFVGHMDRRIVEAPLALDRRLDLAALEEAFADATAGGRPAAYLLCSPHNPTGTVHTRDELGQVAELAGRYRVRVVVDEIHGPLALPGATFVPFLSIDGAGDAFAVTSASKGWNLAGLKGALVLAGPAAKADLARLPEEVSHGPSHLGLIAHTAALRYGGAWLDDVVVALDGNRRLLADLLRKHLPTVGYAPPQATFLAWLDCRSLGLDHGAPDPADVGLVTALAGPARAFLDTARVALSSGHAFGTGGAGHVRLNFATSAEILTEAVERMGTLGQRPSNLVGGPAAGPLPFRPDHCNFTPKRGPGGTMEIPTVSDRYTADQVREYYDSGYWTAETFGGLLDRQAAARGDKTFITDGTTAYTYRELRDVSGRVAAGLRERGLRAGDRVAVQLPNWSEFAVVAAAVARLGAVMVPIMPVYRREEVGHVLDDAQVSVVVTGSVFRGFDYLGMFRDLAATRPAVHTILVVRDEDVPDDGIVTTLVAVAVAATATLGEPVTADDPYVIVYTSGTTARPKGCVHTLNTYLSGARQLTEAFAFTAEDVGFSPSPVTHTTGLVTGILMPLMNGGSTHVMPEWEPRRGLAEIARYRCSVTVTATAFIQMALDAFDPAEHDASSIRVWVSAGAPIPRAVIERARALLPAAKILSLYGRSENLCTTTCTVTDDPEKSLVSDGSALPFASVRVVDELGDEVPIGDEGDIAYTGPSHMLGYLGRPQETAELYTPAGYSRSGDLGRMDADGFVRVTGRTKDIVIRGGMNISVREVEDLLVEHDGVRSVAVVGMPDERLGERVCCYLVATDPARPPSLDELKTYLAARGVAVQKAPERLELVTEIPTTATGKVQKHLLRQDIARKLARVPSG